MTAAEMVSALVAGDGGNDENATKKEAEEKQESSESEGIDLDEFSDIDIGRQAARGRGVRGGRLFSGAVPRGQAHEPQV